jgi:hypothetical protein
MRKDSTRYLVWVAAAVTFALFACISGFFSFGSQVPLTSDLNPGFYSHFVYHFPPQATYLMDYWLGQPLMPQDLQPLSLLTHLPMWIFFSGYYPLFAALSLLSCYAFLRELGFRRGVALVGGVIYAWQGDLFSTTLAGHFPASTVWALFALAGYFAVRSAKERSWFLAASCGVCTGMMVTLLPDRGGLCSLLIAGFYFLEIGRKRAALGHEALKHLGRLALVTVVAVVVAAPGVFTTLSWTVIGSKQAGVETPAQKYDWATQWSYTPEEILSYAVPGFYGWYNGHKSGPYWGRIGRSSDWVAGETKGMRNFCLAIFTLGTIGFVCAIAGSVWVWGRKSRHEVVERKWLDGTQMAYGRFAAVAAVLGWLLALGKYAPFYAWFYHLPYMDTWRNPLKFLAPVSLALVVLIACAVQVWVRVLEDRAAQAEPVRRRVQRYFNAATVGMGLFWALSFPLLLPLGAVLVRMDYTWAEIGLILSTMRWALFLAFVELVLASAAWRLLSRDPEKRRREFINPLIQKTWNALMDVGNEGRTWMVALAVLTIMQMLWVHRHYVELYDLKSYYGLNPLLYKFQPRDELFRVSVDVNDPFLRQLLATVFPYHGIQSVDIPAASRVPEDYDRFFKALESNPSRKLQLAGVKYFLASLPAWQNFEKDPQLKTRIAHVERYAFTAPAGSREPTHAVVELKGSLPRAALIPKAELIENEETLLKRLADPAWNPLQTVLVNRADLEAAQPEPDSTDPEVKRLPPVARIAQYDGRSIVVDVQTPTPSYLVIGDRYDVAWKATVNGHPMPIFAADYLLRGLAVPVGISRVVLYYDLPMTVYYVQLIALGVFAVYAIVWLALRRLYPHK